MSALDIEKFRKVHRLMSGGATEGERSAARARAEAIAAKAGMSLKEAVSSLDAKPKAQPHVFDFGASFDDHMEQKHPGWKAQEAQKRFERGQRDAARRAGILKEYGSIANLLARQPQEEALAAALAPFVTGWDEWMDELGRWHRFAKTIQGRKKPMCFWEDKDVSPEVRDAITHSIPWPPTLGAALAEVEMWDRLRLDRGLAQGHEWENYPEVEIRANLLEEALKSGQPAATWEDVQARFDWRRHEFRRQWIDPQELNDPFMDRIEADIAALRESGPTATPNPTEQKSDNRRPNEPMSSYISRFFSGLGRPIGSDNWRDGV